MACAFVIALVTCALLIRAAFVALQDHPGERSLHAKPMPRSGGIAIVLALLCILILWPLDWPVVTTVPVMLSMALLCVVSFWDDLASTTPLARLCAQLLVGGVTVFWGGYVWQPLHAVPVLFQLLSLFAIVWAVNLYNFMDGMDGFAAGMALFGFGFLGAVGWWHGEQDFAQINWLIVACVAGFWCWNFPPAKIFMGDIGSTLLGYLGAVLSIHGWQLGLYPAWVPLVIFAPFWTDASYTLCKRILRRERFWLPHRSHFYQRLVLAGLGHRKVVLAEYGLMACGGLSVLLCLWLGLGYNQGIAIFWLVIYGLMIVWLERRLSMQESPGQ